MDNVDKYINDFNSSIDKELELEQDLNEFAKEISEKLFNELDKDGVLANFNNEVNFSFKFSTRKFTPGAKAIIYDVRLLDLDNYKKCILLCVPEQVKIKKASFEHDISYTLKDELRNVLVMLLFDYFGIPMGAQDLGEDEIATGKL